MLTEELYWITSTVSMVASVETKSDLLRIGLLKKGLNLFLIFDMRFGVRMEHHSRPKRLERCQPLCGKCR